MIELAKLIHAGRLDGISAIFLSSSNPPLVSEPDPCTLVSRLIRYMNPITIVFQNNLPGLQLTVYCLLLRVI